MPLSIVRNDITKIETQAIVNTANQFVQVGPGCDTAVYHAAGYDKLLAYRKDNIGEVEEGKAFLTPGFALKAKYIIHAVCPLYIDGKHNEESLLRTCYRNSLALAKENNITSIAFPLLSTGSFAYPKEEGLRIAVDECNSFLLKNDMDITLVVFDNKATDLGKKLYPDLETYIDQNYVAMAKEREYGKERRSRSARICRQIPDFAEYECVLSCTNSSISDVSDSIPEFDYEKHESKLNERMQHLSDTYSEYLMYLIQSKGLENADVYKRAIVDKKIFSKIKNNRDYHPNKLTALCLCIGAMLNIDETRDLLSRAGYALSPCDKTDVIFSYFIENGIYDMIELDLQLEEHGMPCIIC